MSGLDKQKIVATEETAIDKPGIQRFLCPICQVLIKTAVSCAECMNIFCNSCSVNFKTCPMCRKDFKSNAIPKILLSILDECKFKCPFCDENFTQNTVEKHRDSCSKFLIQCPTRCGYKSLKTEDDLKQHLITFCTQSEAMVEIFKSENKIKNNPILQGLEAQIDKHCNETIKKNFKDLQDKIYGIWPFPSWYQFQNSKVEIKPWDEQEITYFDDDEEQGQGVVFNAPIQEPQIQIEQNKEGQIEGKFIMVSEHKVQFGFCKDGYREGHGIDLYESGEKFEGHFKNGQRNGFGVHVEKNDKYEGNYKNGKQHGKGTWSDHQGNKETGIWFKDQQQGIAILTKKNRDQFEIEYQNGDEIGRKQIL